MKKNKIVIIIVIALSVSVIVLVGRFYYFHFERMVMLHPPIIRQERKCDPFDILETIDSSVDVPKDPLKVIDRILERMDFGNISFNTPHLLKLNETAIIHLALGAEKSIDTLKSLIKAVGEKVGARIRISHRMEARLSGHNFQITAIQYFSREIRFFLIENI